MMLRSFPIAFLAMLAIPVFAADPPAKTGVLVFDNCDNQYKGKAKYEDNLTFVDSSGEQVFRISGFNNCESIGSSRMIAVDSPRNSIWVVENVAHRIRRFDFSGKETLAIPLIHGSAIAVDPDSGHLWAFSGDGHIGKGKTVVFNEKDFTAHRISGSCSYFESRMRSNDGSARREDGESWEPRAAR